MLIVLYCCFLILLLELARLVTTLHNNNFSNVKDKCDEIRNLSKRALKQRECEDGNDDEDKGIINHKKKKNSEIIISSSSLLSEKSSPPILLQRSGEMFEKMMMMEKQKSVIKSPESSPVVLELSRGNNNNYHHEMAKNRSSPSDKLKQFSEFCISLRKLVHKVPHTDCFFVGTAGALFFVYFHFTI